MGIAGYNVHDVYQPDFPNLPSHIPFAVHKYMYKGGDLWSVPRYLPDGVTSTSANRKWFWQNPLVWIGPCYWETIGGAEILTGPIDSWAGFAMVEAQPDDIRDPDENCYYWYEEEGAPENTACEGRTTGPGYNGNEGITETLECYEVWYVWYDEDGNITWEEYAGFDVCFRNGLME